MSRQRCSFQATTSLLASCTSWQRAVPSNVDPVLRTASKRMARGYTTRFKNYRHVKWIQPPDLWADLNRSRFVPKHCNFTFVFLLKMFGIMIRLLGSSLSLSEWELTVMLCSPEYRFKIVTSFRIFDSRICQFPYAVSLHQQEF